MSNAEEYRGGAVAGWGHPAGPARPIEPKPPMTEAERRAVARVTRLALAARYGVEEPDDEMKAPMPAKAEAPRGEPTPTAKPTRTAKLTRLSTVRSERARFLLPKRIPMRVVTIVAGRGGEGKSTWMVDIAARCTRGELDGDIAGGPVLMIGGEDDLATVVRPRLEAASADLQKVHAMTVETTVEAVSAESVPVLPLDVALIRTAIKDSGARLVVIDPLASSMDGNPDRLAEVRAAVDPLAALAAEMDVAVVCIMHFRKGAGNTADLLSGSHAFRDAARSVLLIATDEQTGHRVLTIEKSNYSDARGESFAFALESVEVPVDAGGTTTAVRAIDLGTSDVSVDDIVNAADTLTGLSERMQALAAAVGQHQEDKGIEVAQAAIEAGVDQDTARKYLPRLVKSGLIERASRGRYRALGTPVSVCGQVSQVSLPSP